MLDIKRASLVDLQQLLPLFENYQKFYQIRQNSGKCFEFLTQRLNKKDSIIYLAYSDQTAVGFAQIFPQFSSMAMQVIWLLNDLYVNQENRQRGVATQLVKNIENQAACEKIFSIKLATAINNEKARKLYDSLGYTTIDQFKHYSKLIKSA